MTWKSGLGVTQDHRK